MSRSWILLGMMGAGKSAIGRSLAVLAAREFLDTDQILQHRLGRPINQLFAIYGEDAFRKHESSLLKSLEPSHTVLSTGGGIVVREENWPELRRLGITVYLEADPKTLIDRLERSRKKRPLLQLEEWRERVVTLLEQRRALYSRADVIVRLDNEDVEAGAVKVLKALTEFEER